jgi:hypothetical protein
MPLLPCAQAASLAPLRLHGARRRKTTGADAALATGPAQLLRFRAKERTKRASLDVRIVAFFVSGR